MTPAAVNALVAAGLELDAAGASQALSIARVAQHGSAESFKDFQASLKPKSPSTSADAKFREAVRNMPNQEHPIG